MESNEQQQLEKLLQQVLPGFNIHTVRHTPRDMGLGTEFEIGNSGALFDPIKKPSHYNQHGIEAIQAIEASMSSEEFKGYLKGNCIKYIWRYSYKGKMLEDLEKAKVYLGWLIERVKNVKS